MKKLISKIVCIALMVPAFAYAGGVAVTEVATLIPKPEHFAMVLAGLGLMATIARRRRSSRKS